jgi:hypothetical protein
MRKAHFIESRRKPVDAEEPAGEKPKPKRQLHPNSLKNLAPPFPPGVSGNPGGLPGTDKAQLAAREFFETYPRISKEMIRALRGFNGFGFATLADRAFGRVVEKHQVTAVGVSLEDVLRARKRAQEGPGGDAFRKRLQPATPADTPADTDVPDNPEDV